MLIPKLIAGGIVVAPSVYFPAITLGQFAVCLVLALIVAACMPDEWRE